MTGVRQSIDRLLERRRESRDLAALQAEIERLRTQNDRLRNAMRRCVTCDYRLGAATERTVESTVESTAEIAVESGAPASDSSNEEDPAAGIAVEAEEGSAAREGAQR